MSNGLGRAVRASVATSRVSRRAFTSETMVKPQPSQFKESLASRKDEAYQNIPWTAFYASYLKAPEDPFVRCLFNPEDLHNEIFNNLCGGHYHAWPMYRVHFYDRIMKQSVSGRLGHHSGKGYRPVTQMVTLGAGLDTRSVRTPTVPGRRGEPVALRFYETDCENLLNYKQLCFQHEGYSTDRLVCVPGNYVTEFDKIFARFEEQGLKRDQPTMVTWEGNIMYNPHNDVLKTVVNVCDFFRDTALYFAYDSLPSAMIADPSGTWREEVGLAHVMEKITEMGCPFVNGLDDHHKEVVEPVNKMLEEAGIPGTIALISDESCMTYADPVHHPDVNDDAHKYRMVNIIYDL
eukprot:Clim_evm37s7 gene=Clim_evmTU37s7